MTNDHSSVVRAQFGAQAEAYVTSVVHASGADLDWMETRVRDLHAGRVLDLGCGGGHVSYRVAAHVDEVVACDLSEEMLAAVAATAADRGIGNIATRMAAAEALPFAEGEFDMVLTRFSAHHWTELDAGLREAARVLKRGRPMLVVDSLSPGAPLLDTHIQAVEALRDPSHVRNRSAGEWTAALTSAGLPPLLIETRRLRMDFSVWTRRMRTPDAAVAAIRYLQESLPSEARAHFAIEPDGSFMLDTVWIEAGRV